MECSSEFIDYTQTGYFSKMITDYIAADEKLQSFYKHPASIDGIKSAIDERKQFITDRSLLVSGLQKQYSGTEISIPVKNNIEALLSENTFTVCTAHQPNIFTGPLYFIYKILHAVQLAEFLHKQLPAYNFVPVYYMGSEDADLEELGHVYINNEKHQWKTEQTGAIGRMKVDKALVKIIETISGQLMVQPFGNEIMVLIKDCYKDGVSIEQATFTLVNELFAEYGLLILLPDNASIKKAFIPVIEKELMQAFSHTAVEETIGQFPAEYKLRATGRELNMFYLNEGSRERIEMAGDEWSVINTGIKFTKDELRNELHMYPERFSPNVILRPVLQEFILPNVAFIGGGGEIAYWLQLTKVFEAVAVPYPVLVVRNSFMLVEKNYVQILKSLQLKPANLFKSSLDILNELVKRDTSIQVSLEKEMEQLEEFYQQVKVIAGQADITLQQHTEALKVAALKKISSLEKKILRAERKKFDAQQRQLNKLLLHLFPNDNLQERVENIMPLYARWGRNFIQTIYEKSLSLEQQFRILLEK